MTAQRRLMTRHATLVRNSAKLKSQKADYKGQTAISGWLRHQGLKCALHRAMREPGIGPMVREIGMELNKCRHAVERDW